MSGSGTIYTEQSVLGHTLGFAPMAFPARVFVGLCSAAMPPSETVQGVEAFGNGYARQQAQFALIDTPANIAANVATVEYPLATGSGWGTLGFFELWDAPAGGNRLYWGALIDTSSQLPVTITVSGGDIVRFSAGTLAVQAATGAGGISSVGAYLPLAGGTLLGPLLLASDPTTYLQAATKQYVDAHSGTGGGPGFLPLSGGTMLGQLALGSAATAPLSYAATGATAVLAAQDRVAAAYSVRDFGAKCDGTTDDSAAINAAIAAIIALPTGGKLILPSGRTVVGSAIVASIPAGVALTIEGMGQQASELYFSNATDGLNFKLLNSGNAWGAINLLSFTLTRGPLTPAMANTGINVWADPAPGKMYYGAMAFRDLVVQGSGLTRNSNQWLNSLVLNGLTTCSLDNVIVLGNNGTITDLGDALLTINGPSTSQYCSGINIVNSLFQGGSAGINITGYVQGVFITNSGIIGQYDSIRWAQTVHGGEELAIANCTLNGKHRGVYTSYVNQNSIGGCAILSFNGGTAAGFAGIEVNNGGYCSITGNNIVASHTGAEYGIIISDCGSNCSNVVVGNAAVNLNAGSAVWFKGTTTGAMAIGNAAVGGGAAVQQDNAPNTAIGNQYNGAPTALTTYQPVVFQNPATGVSRWFVGGDGTTESGGNTGSNFEIVSATDAGALIGTPLRINRANGIITMLNPPILTNIPANFANDAAAATGGISVGGTYRNGSVLQVRVT